MHTDQSTRAARRNLTPLVIEMIAQAEQLLADLKQVNARLDRLLSADQGKSRPLSDHQNSQA